MALFIFCLVSSAPYASEASHHHNTCLPPIMISFISTFFTGRLSLLSGNHRIFVCTNLSYKCFVFSLTIESRKFGTDSSMSQPTKIQVFTGNKTVIVHSHFCTTTLFFNPACSMVALKSSRVRLGNVVPILYGRVRFSGRELQNHHGI